LYCDVYTIFDDFFSYFLLIKTKCFGKLLADIKDGNAQPAYIIGLLILHAAAILPTMYTLQFAFSGAATGYVVIVFYNQLTGKKAILSI